MNVTTSLPRRLERERRYLLIRLYNLGYDDNRIQEYLKIHQDESYILKSKLLAIVGRDFDDFFSSFLQLVVCHDHQTKTTKDNNKVPLKPFLFFLKNGTLPMMMMNTTSTISANMVTTQETISENEKSCDDSMKQAQHSTNNNTEQWKNRNNENKGEAVWKKHETIIQERIVVYVSKDKEGSTHTVTETDKTQKDIIHVENSSGFFAHREYTQQEQTEDMDDEQITCIRASEECIHLKRDDDEYEYVHTEIPPNPQEYIHGDVYDDDDDHDEDDD